MSEPSSHLSTGGARARLRAVLAERLNRIGVRPVRDLSAADLQRVHDVDALVAQSVRAARHTAGSVRAYASLIADGYAHEANASLWASKIERSAKDLDEFASRFGTLRVCAGERATTLEWGDLLGRVASRCADLGTCTIEANDRSNGPCRQRAELLARVLFQIVRNGVEAAPRGGSVRLRVDEWRAAQTRVFHVRVADDGPGIAGLECPEDAWRPFVSTKPDHAGLGLAFVAACAPVLGAVVGWRRESDRTTIHVLVGEEGDLSW
ncbi:MAG TPA: ATP-binding protein [Candidatus Krumholzibacteria bacterium]|nr:ATP-binding protein [Candidatus Krumholzibacteria bacterium]